MNGVILAAAMVWFPLWNCPGGCKGFCCCVDIKKCHAGPPCDGGK